MTDRFFSLTCSSDCAYIDMKSQRPASQAAETEVLTHTRCRCSALRGTKREFRQNRKLPRNCKWHVLIRPLSLKGWEGRSCCRAMSQETCRVAPRIHAFAGGLRVATGMVQSSPSFSPRRGFSLGTCHERPHHQSAPRGRSARRRGSPRSHGPGRRSPRHAAGRPAA